jgi:CRISPR/Cas system-associated exonuclease Cas4 (RecB family)
MLSFYEVRMRAFSESPAETVTEAFNGLRIRRDFLDFVLEDGKRQLETFGKIVWPQLGDLEYVEHEEFENFYIDDLKVHVKVDYVTRSGDGTIVVTDWKTGQEYIPEKDDIQLAVYGLWASSKYEVPLERVKLELAYLRTGRSIPVELSTDIVREVKEAVLASSAEVLAADFLEDFPTAPAPEKCIACPFATICPDGAETLQELRAQEMLDAVEGAIGRVAVESPGRDQ